MTPRLTDNIAQNGVGVALNDQLQHEFICEEDFSLNYAERLHDIEEGAQALGLIVRTSDVYAVIWSAKHDLVRIQLASGLLNSRGLLPREPLSLLAGAELLQNGQTLKVLPYFGRHNSRRVNQIDEQMHMLNPPLGWTGAKQTGDRVVNVLGVAIRFENIATAGHLGIEAQTDIIRMPAKKTAKKTRKLDAEDVRKDAVVRINSPPVPTDQKAGRHDAGSSTSLHALLFDGIYVSDDGEMKFVVRHEDEIRSLTYKEVKETDPRGLCDYLIGKVKFVKRKDDLPLASLAIPLGEQRQQILKQIADEFGLRFNAFFFNQIEQCFFSLIGNVDVSLTLTIDATLLTAKIACHAARHLFFAGPPIQPEVTFLWPLTDWNQFLWSVRGIFSKFFVGLRCDRTTKHLAINGARPMEESPAIPVIEQPEDDDNDGERGSGGHNEDSSRFSVAAVPHRDLPLEKIANDLMLRLVRVPGKRIKFLPYEQHRTKKNDNFLYFEDLNLSPDGRAWIRVVQGNNCKDNEEIKKEQWLKINRELLTYAIMGKCSLNCQTEQQHQQHHGSGGGVQITKAYSSSIILIQRANQRANSFTITSAGVCRYVHDENLRIAYRKSEHFGKLGSEMSIDLAGNFNADSISILKTIHGFTQFVQWNRYIFSSKNGLKICYLMP
uniref:Secreted protein n=1 Tax=Globodera rostochiensis TaxID=31243 RepID=A0A914HUY0_GLORO